MPKQIPQKGTLKVTKNAPTWLLLGPLGGVLQVTFSCFFAFWPQGVPKIGPRGAQGVPRATPRCDFESFWLEIWSILDDFGTILLLGFPEADILKKNGERSSLFFRYRGCVRIWLPGPEFGRVPRGPGPGTNFHVF